MDLTYFHRVKRLLKNGIDIEDETLESGPEEDFIEVEVMGAVAKPGRYRVPRNSILLVALEAAGGLRRAHYWQMHGIIRWEEDERRELDWSNDPMKDCKIVLEDGDVVHIAVYIPF